ncbi:MAG: toprim domain-containing protein [Candidatus Burarchaeum sp.]|nr:toprim domain-containing protein [Candidatus Burarchaeum sp.]MDO8340117.1 toprim domain-containing protein [Candidatus Burarchaeum sp.]
MRGWLREQQASFERQSTAHSTFALILFACYWHIVIALRARNPEQGRLERKEKLLGRVLAKLDESVVIVEGKKDVWALRNIGVKGKLMEASGRVKGICPRLGVAACEAGLNADEVVVLTDADGAGEELAAMLVGELDANGVKPNLQVRRDLRFVLGFRTVEEIPRKLEEFREKVRGKRIEKS